MELLFCFILFVYVVFAFLFERDSTEILRFRKVGEQEGSGGRKRGRSQNVIHEINLRTTKKLRLITSNV